MTVLERAAQMFVGTHDFRSFTATEPDLATRNSNFEEQSDGGIQTEARTAIRTIYSSSWTEETQEAGNLLVYRVRGNGFLHHMVRNLVGTMLDVGRGYIPCEDIPTILAALIDRPQVPRHRREACFCILWSTTNSGCDLFGLQVQPTWQGLPFH